MPERISRDFPFSWPEAVKAVKAVSSTNCQLGKGRNAIRPMTKARIRPNGSLGDTDERGWTADRRPPRRTAQDGPTAGYWWFLHRNPAALADNRRMRQPAGLDRLSDWRS
jgi:hypothetical protein